MERVDPYVKIAFGIRNMAKAHKYKTNELGDIYISYPMFFLLICHWVSGCF